MAKTNIRINTRRVSKELPSFYIFKLNAGRTALHKLGAAIDARARLSYGNDYKLEYSGTVLEGWDTVVSREMCEAGLEMVRVTN
mmetsp:Transcript_2443/g.6158  ORF Transcript_2443/g.6158 Transcript_2443/m.6158 type:complete len:84 (+) Transcript_2443:542-793(+)